MIVDSRAVDRVLAPASAGELAEMMRSETGTIAPVGAGTELSLGNPLEPIDAAIDTRRLDRITEYVPADLTIHVESGVRLGQLAGALAEHGQMLPLDPWNGPEATIGGVVATNAQGPLRAVGTVRDWIIGMQVVDAGGRASKTGGRVVKNVSGYDLAKLYTGSLGSLAVISEVSFKLRAAFAATASARLRPGGLAEAADVIREIRSGPLEPVSLVWAGAEDPFVAVRFGEHPRAVEWQLDRLPGEGWERFDAETESAVWDAVRDRYRALAEPVVRVAAPPSDARAVLERFRPASWLVHAANGTILMTAGVDAIARLRERYPTLVERAPREVRLQAGVFGLTGAEYDLMRRVKTAFDPEGRLNPGRHVDGERPA